MRQLSACYTMIASALAGLLSIGCVDPEGEYDDFKERDEKTTKVVGTGCGDPGAACDAVTPGDLTGQWLFAFSAIVPTKPVLFFADITANDAGGELQWEWSIVPLDAKTRTPVPGSPAVKVGPTTIPADGKWSADLDPMDVPGEANFISGSPINADVVLSGDICGNRNFLCGDMTGNLTKPFPADLDGSTWTLQKLETPDTVPTDIYVDCECTKAEAPTP
jgi:hypothetical protein